MSDESFGGTGGTKAEEVGDVLCRSGRGFEDNKSCPDK